MRGRRGRAGGDTHRWIRDWKRLDILPLSFLDLSNLFVIECSEFFKPGVWISVYTWDILVWTRLFRAHYPVVCCFALAVIFDCDRVKDVLLFTTL
jgi:hypothetical protein